MSSFLRACFSIPLNRFAKPSIHRRWVAVSRNDTIMKATVQRGELYVKRTTRCVIENVWSNRGNGDTRACSVERFLVLARTLPPPPRLSAEAQGLRQMRGKGQAACTPACSAPRLAAREFRPPHLLSAAGP